ncbi:hypothetical protein [Frankia sp. Cas3]|uniref:hypothetical protein n=1 Tax=Frankia sp. Cas3 TaxID=3073926 RepID=UPI002AD4A67F|nr:hypothetical protein [Frankia sp. Cas3]
MVTNIHARTVAGSVEAAGALLDTLAGPDDRLWPTRGWPPIHFDRPLGVGAGGGHGPIRYAVDSYTPGRDITFRFDPRIGLVGTHHFTVASQPGGRVELRHTLTGRTTGTTRLSWPLVYRPLHDALIEDALDNAERELTGTLASRPAGWSRRVRLLRGVLARTRRQPGATQPPSLLPGAAFGSRYSRRVAASPEAVRQAILDLETTDLPLTGILTTMRSLPAHMFRRTGPGETTGTPEPTRLVDQLAGRGFVRLADEPTLLALGTVARFWQPRPARAQVADAAGFAAFDEPGWAKVATALTIVSADGGRSSILTTTTAIAPTDDAARRAFGRYWALIRVPSGLIRREWLAAIARRAEATPT